MATDYAIARHQIQIEDLFDGSLRQLGIEEHIEPGQTNEIRRCLTDKQNYLWVYRGKESGRVLLSRYGLPNVVQYILSAIQQTYDVTIYSEHQPQYWGYKTDEEWDAAWEAIDDGYRRQFFDDVRKYVRGEPNDIQPGTAGEAKAEIAKHLARECPDVLAPEFGEMLLSKVDDLYERDHLDFFKLDESQMQFVERTSKRSNDLPEC